MFELHHSTQYHGNPARRGGVNPPLHHATRRITLVLALIGWMSAVTLPVFSQAGPEPSQRALTLEDRIGYQRAIEEVYWRHRIWPQQNGSPKPDLEVVMPDDVIRAKVEDYLLKSRALAVYWQRPIRPEQLQAEMDRMARQTKQPEMLRELWAALRNNPYVIAECLARPVLANRLVRNWYSYDQRYHGELKKRIVAELRAYGSASQMREMSGEYREVEWVKGESSQEAGHMDSVTLSPSQRSRVDFAKNPTLALSPEEWETSVRELAQAFAPGPQTLSERERVARDLSLLPSPLGRGDHAGPGEGAVPASVRSELDPILIGEVSPLQEDDERFYAVTVLEKGNEQLKLASVEWKKEPVDTWWGSVREQMQDQLGATQTVAGRSGGSSRPNVAPMSPARGDPELGYQYRLPPIAPVSGSCADDTWTPTSGTDVQARSNHTAVWTGSEMIIWGGSIFNGLLDTGGRYDPATGTLMPTSTTTAPSARQGHTAVWTGTEMIVWGGLLGDGVYTNTGGRYNPASDTWVAVTTSNVPTGRSAHTAVWTGSEMIVWGGFIGADLNSGGRYNPLADTWTPTSTNNAPSARDSHTAVWTGSEMIVWGGTAGSSLYLNTGGRYNPATDTWAATSAVDAPSGRTSHTAVWAGNVMIVWGGFIGADLNSGGRYNPLADTWTPTSTNNAPSARDSHTAVWTGSEMIVWGGTAGSSVYLNTGGRYDPATDAWTETSASNAPTARADHAAVWTSTEMIVWGGVNGSTFFNRGGRYDPATDTWTTSDSSIAPSPRRLHTGVWTGSEMIVWGGLDNFGWFNTGGRYNPATDSWTATTTTNAPSARYEHSAIWTGNEMIVWGGSVDFPTYFNTGGRYDPATDTWTATDTNSAPSPRAGHTAIWSDSGLIIWGGFDAVGSLNTGGRYDPAGNTWMATSTTNAPSVRAGHTAVWNGSEMIIWGGFNSFPLPTYLNSGGRYAPATDTWTATDTTTAPSARLFHTAVWTGSEMIVWGGRSDSMFFNSGGRYAPATDTWTATDTTTAPSARASHTAVWTGTEMIVWGGSPLTDTGGGYCAVPPSPGQ